MSMRLPLTCCEKVIGTPPARRKLPSCTLRTRNFAVSKIKVSETVDSRAASATISGTVYGPPPTLNVVGPEISTCAEPMPEDCVCTGGVVAGAPGAAAGGFAGSGVAPGGAVAGCAAPAGAVAAGGFVAAPAAGGVTAGVGSGVPGSVCGVGGVAPGCSG